MADSTLMAVAVPQYFPQENRISWVGMMKLLFTVHKLHKALTTDLNSIPDTSMLIFLITNVLVYLSVAVFTQAFLVAASGSSSS